MKSRLFKAYQFSKNELQREQVLLPEQTTKLKQGMHPQKTDELGHKICLFYLPTVLLRPLTELTRQDVHANNQSILMRDLWRYPIC